MSRVSVFGAVSSAAFAALIFVSAASAQQLALQGPSSSGPPGTPPGGPEAANYQHDDGTVENGVGITGTTPFDIIWLNRFAVAPGGELITSISTTYGSPADVRPYNGLPVSILLYNDPDGGSTTNATLVHSQGANIANANTNNFNTYAVPSVPVSGFFLVGVLARNLPGGNGFVASIDETDPDTAGVSFAGFTVGTPLNENNLASLGANYGAIEGFGLPGNWTVRAVGNPVPEPASFGLLGLGAVALVRRRRA